MRLGLVMRLRRRAIARWLLALLLLPVVLGLMPAAQVSAEQALARDLALSICSPNGAQNPQKSPASHDQQCVLCTVGCITCAPASPGSATATMNPAPAADPVVLTASIVSRPHWTLWRDGAPPRGPPLSVGV